MDVVIPDVERAHAVQIDGAHTAVAPDAASHTRWNLAPML